MPDMRDKKTGGLTKPDPPPAGGREGMMSISNTAYLSEGMEAVKMTEKQYPIYNNDNGWRVELNIGNSCIVLTRKDAIKIKNKLEYAIYQIDLEEAKQLDTQLMFDRTHI